MGTETEPAKLLLPYLQRADELQKPEPLVAYYCRLYAMERGLKIPAKERTKMTSSLLISIMNQLEKDKKSLELGPEDNLYVEGFASNVFARADKQDRAGRADLNTAKTFYAASIFFEILNQFGPLQPDIEQKQKYAVWKAADIRKALKEGRTPAPGPPGDDDELSILSSGTNDNIGPSEPPSTNYRSEPDPSQFRDSKNYRSEPDLSQFHDSTNYRNEPDPSPFHDSVNDRHSTNFPPPSKFHDNPKNEQNPTNIPGPAFQYHDKASNNNDHQSPPSAPQQHHYNDEPLDRHLASFPSVPQTYPAPGYSSRDDFPPSEPSDYPHQPYHQQQSYGQDQPPPQPHHLQPHSSFPHFQSYPSFSESSLPVVPPNFPPPYYQGSDGNFAPASNLPVARLVSEPAPLAPAPVPAFEYDCNYMPPPEKITEAHKAARFAVGALAFDDVSVAVDYLRKSLELLTNPSAKSGQWT